VRAAFNVLLGTGAYGGGTARSTTKEEAMRKRMTAVVAIVAALGLTASAVAAGGHHHARAAAGASRLDDGKDLLPQAKITEAQAIAAARSAAAGALDEVDLEHAGGKLVFNVDVGDHDVKVDAANGGVVSVDQDD
jgi:uncharacterized membrane protein YkoI